MGGTWHELLASKESAMACVQGVCIVVLDTCGRGMWVGRLGAQCLDCMEWVECVECMVYGWRTGPGSRLVDGVHAVNGMHGVGWDMCAGWGWGELAIHSLLLPQDPGGHGTEWYSWHGPSGALLGHASVHALSGQPHVACGNVMGWDGVCGAPLPHAHRTLRPDVAAAGEGGGGGGHTRRPVVEAAGEGHPPAGIE